MSFKKLLDEFESLPEILEIKDKFNEGVPRSYVLEQTASLNLDFMEDLFDLYSWHNGMKNLAVGKSHEVLGDPYEGKCFFGTATFLPLDVSTTIYEIKANAISNRPMNEKSTFFKRELFPFCSEDDILYINLDSRTKNYGKIYIQNVGAMIVEPMLIFSSLRNMFLTISDGFRNGIYYFGNDEFDDKTDEKHIMKDYARFREHGRIFNPDCDYWRITDGSLESYKYVLE